MSTFAKLIQKSKQFWFVFPVILNRFNNTYTVPCILNCILFSLYARADSKAKREALEKAYTELTPNREAEKSWESNKNLRNWLKDLKK